MIRPKFATRAETVFNFVVTAGVILSKSPDWIESRTFDCKNCGEITLDEVERIRI